MKMYLECSTKIIFYLHELNRIDYIGKPLCFLLQTCKHVKVCKERHAQLRNAMPLKRQPVGVKRREPEVLSCTLSCETPLPLIRHPLSLGHLSEMRNHGEWRARERERNRERFHLIDKEFFSASCSQPCISTFDPNVDEERFGRDFKKEP